jgi:hypothetical protein
LTGDSAAAKQCGGKSFQHESAVINKLGAIGKRFITEKTELS